MSRELLWHYCSETTEGVHFFGTVGSKLIIAKSKLTNRKFDQRPYLVVKLTS